MTGTPPDRAADPERRIVGTRGRGGYVALPINPATGRPPVLCIDADCPACGWAERTFDTGTRLFGCPKCDYTSKERNA